MSGLVLAMSVCVLPAGGAARPGVSQRGELARRIVGRHKAVFPAPPRRIPSRVQTDAPLLGNGDMGAALGGGPESLRLWLCKNDLWRLNSRHGTSGPRVFGGLDIRLPQMRGATYRVEQSLWDAVTRGSFTKGGRTVELAAWVAATANVLVVELRAVGGAVSAEVALDVARGPDSNESAGVEGGVSWAVRRFVRGVEIPSGAAAAMKVLGAEAGAVTLRPGRPVTVVVGMASVFKHADFPAAARRLVAGLDAAGVEALRRRHAAWWADYWSRCLVELDDKAIEQRYYLSLYVLASTLRDREFPPGLFGVWVTSDRPAWSGDYHLNYNYQAPFYGLYSSNRIEQAEPYDAPILAFLERGRRYARQELHCRGVYYPVGIGPRGIDTTWGGQYDRRGDPGPGLFCGQKSNAAYCVTNMTARWRHTLEEAYARRVYPFVREVATFWEDYLRWEEASRRWVIVNDAVHENTFGDFNPIVSLALVRGTMETALEMSAALGIDADRRKKWRHIADHLSRFPTQQREGRTVFRYTERGTAWWRGNTLGIQHIYPGRAIGPESDPRLLEVARNTIEVMGRWVDNNGTNSFFPAAVRAGYDPNVILSKLGEYVAKHCQPNGFAAHNPHGIENCSTVPNTVNMMLCSADRGVLRVFGCWPRHRPARFVDIRTAGALRVSAELAGGEVRYVRIVSERGRPFVLVNPWPGRAVVARRGGGGDERLSGARLRLSVAAGGEVVLRPAGAAG